MKNFGNRLFRLRNLIKRNMCSSTTTTFIIALLCFWFSMKILILYCYYSCHYYCSYFYCQHSRVTRYIITKLLFIYFANFVQVLDLILFCSLFIKHTIIKKYLIFSRRFSGVLHLIRQFFTCYYLQTCDIGKVTEKGLRRNLQYIYVSCNYKS